MPSRTLPGIGLKGDWNLGEGGWKDEMDLNMVIESVMLGGYVDETVSALPGSAGEGDIVILDETAVTDANKVAVYDEATWKIFAVPTGTRLYDKSVGVHRQFDGGSWPVLSSEGGGGTVTSTSSGLVSGGAVVWESGYTYRVSAAAYDIEGNRYTSAEQTVTLDAADATNPRIDVIALDTSGSVVKITGTPGATASEPDTPVDHLKLTFIFVAAATTEPEESDVESIYLENTEWMVEFASGTFDADSTADPYQGTKAIEVTSPAANDRIDLAPAGSFTLGSFDLLVFHVKVKANWAKKNLRLQFIGTGGAPLGSQVTLGNGLFGFNANDTGAYQQVAMPVSQFAVSSAAAIGLLRISVSGSIGFHLDNITLRSADGTSTGAVSGITQEQADARYVPLSALDVDATLAADSDDRVPTQAAVKAYVDDAVSGAGGGGLSDGDYGHITVSGSGTVMTVDDGVLDVANFDAAVIVTEVEGIASSDNDTSIPTSAAVKAYADEVAPDAVTDLTMSTAGIIGRTTAGSGSAEELTAAQVRAFLLTETWDFNFAADGYQVIRASEAMTITQQATSGTGSVAYEKSTNAAPDTFSSTSSPVTLEAGAKLKVTASSVTATYAVHLERTA